MADPLFVTIDEVITRMQLSAELHGIQPVLESAIQGAQIHIESVLDCRLALEDHVVVFHTDPDAFSRMQPNGLFRLYLPSGFVRGTPTITVGAAPFGPFPDTADPTKLSLDREKGIISLDAETFIDKYIRVECQTGFDLEGDPLADPPVAPDARPEWLKEAILCYVPITLDVSQTTNRNAEAMEQYKRAADHAMVAVTRGLRTSLPFCLRDIGV